MRPFLNSVWAVLVKDAKSEFRTRYALSAILLFALASVATVSFALKGERLEPRQAAALAWIVVFFAAVAGLSRPFVQEAEAGTELFLRQAARPEAVWLGKFLFNLALMSALEIVIFPLYAGLMEVEIVKPLHLFGIAALGAVSMAGSTTILAAMVAKARSRSSVFAVAALPVLLPLMVFLVEASASCFGAPDIGGGMRAGVISIISYTGILMVLSWLLFPAVWEE